MKNFKLFSCAAIIAATAMFTSCMNQGDKRTGTVFGVIDTMEDAPFSNFAKSTVGYITANSEIFNEAKSGDCCSFTYDIDFENQPAGHPANYVDAVVTNYTKVIESYVDFSSDNESTYTPATKEISFVKVIPQAFIENKLFIGCEFKKSKGQTNTYNLLYNLDSTYTEDNQKIYKLLFTATRDKTDSADDTGIEYTAFDITRLVEQAKSEAPTGSTSTTLNLKIKYINKITTEEGKEPTEWAGAPIVKIGLPVKTA